MLPVQPSSASRITRSATHSHRCRSRITKQSKDRVEPSHNTLGDTVPQSSSSISVHKDSRSPENHTVTQGSVLANVHTLAGRRDLRVGLASRDNLSHTEHAGQKSLVPRSEKLPKCRTSITRRRNEQVREPMARERLASHDDLEVTQARRAPPECPVKSDPQSNVPCREIASVLPVYGDLDGVESSVGGRVAPHACKRVHAGRWNAKLAPRTREDSVGS